MKEAKLKSCPFCGAKLYRWCGKYIHPDNNCVIFAICDGLNGSKDYKDWNKRITEGSGEYEQLSETERSSQTEGH